MPPGKTVYENTPFLYIIRRTIPARGQSEPSEGPDCRKVPLDPEEKKNSAGFFDTVGVTVPGVSVSMTGILSLTA